MVSTEFSSSNGPRTAGGTFPVIDDPADATPSNKLHRWTRVLDAATIAAKYGLGTLTSATMVEAADPQHQVYDGIWYNDVVLTGTAGTKRIPAWTFRNDKGLPSPGFTLQTESSAGRPMGANQRIELQVVGESVTAPDGSVDVDPVRCRGRGAEHHGRHSVVPAGYMTVWPCDVARPEASNLNFVAGARGRQQRDRSGRRQRQGVLLHERQSSHLLVDIAGWFDGSRIAFVGATPRRRARHPQRHRRTEGADSAPVARSRSRWSARPCNGPTASPDTIPANATAVAINVTAVAPSQRRLTSPCGRAARRSTRSVERQLHGRVGRRQRCRRLARCGVRSASTPTSSPTCSSTCSAGSCGGAVSRRTSVPCRTRLVDTRNAIGGPTGVITPATPRSRCPSVV